MNLMEGWSGRYLEDFEVGDRYMHPLGRTVTEADAVWAGGLSMTNGQLYFNAEYALAAGFEGIAVSPSFTLALVTGMSVNDVSQNGINLEWEEIQAGEPLYIGETVYAQSEVLGVRESKSKPGQGIVTVRTAGYTKTEKIVLELRRSILVYKKEAAPQRRLFPETPEWD